MKSRARNRRQSGNGELRPELNMTNMIDVIFAILVVFMITAPLMNQGIQVKLPKVGAPSVQEKESISISITRSRKIFINNSPTEPTHFRRDFRAFWDGNPETLVIINGDKSVPYGFIMKVISAAQKEGAQKIGFLTDPTVRPR